MNITVIYNFSHEVLRNFNKIDYTLTVNTTVCDPKWIKVRIEGEDVTTQRFLLDNLIRFSEENIIDKQVVYTIDTKNDSADILGIQITGFLCNQAGDIIYLSTPVVKESKPSSQQTIELEWVSMEDHLQNTF